VSPSTEQIGVQTERREFPSLRKQIGEDPARWLDRSIADRNGQANRKGVLEGLIDGMDSLARIRAWKAVERRLGRGRDGGPRSWVIEQLDERETTLDRIGERPDRLPHGPWPACDCCDGDGLTAAEARGRREEERKRRVSGYDADGVDTSETTPATEASSLGQFATDGGQDSE